MFSLSPNHRILRDCRTDNLAQKAGQRCGNLHGSIFLNEMNALNGGLALVWPSAAEITDAAYQQGAGLGIYEKFWDLALGKPRTIRFDDLNHIGGRSLDRQFARPYQSRKPRFARTVRVAICGHFFVD